MTLLYIDIGVFKLLILIFSVIVFSMQMRANEL
jgi:hypothetical protein